MAFDVNALVEQYAQAQVAPLQAELDQVKATLATDDAAIAQRDASITDLNGQLAAADSQHQVDQATIAQLQAQLGALTAPPAPKAHVTYGANTGGWNTAATGGESLTAAKARIKAGFGGRLPAIRVWSINPDGTVPPQYADPTCQLYMIELNNGLSLAQMTAIIKGCPKSSVVVPCHEPESKTTPAAYQTFLALAGQAHLASGRTDVKAVAMLMGGTFDPKRYTVDGPGLFWDQWIPATLPAGVDAIGGDLYPWGANDAKADTAAYVIGSAKAAAAKLGVPFYVGEFGCGSPKWSDPVRAKYTSDAFDIFDADPGTFPVVCVFEAANGSSGPWAILPHLDGTGGYPLTTAVVAKRFTAVPTA